MWPGRLTCCHELLVKSFNLDHQKKDLLKIRVVLTKKKSKELESCKFGGVGAWRWNIGRYLSLVTSVQGNCPLTFSFILSIALKKYYFSLSET